MRFGTSRRGALAVAVLVAGALSLSACSAARCGSDDEQLPATEITFLTNNDPNNVKIAEAVIKAFEEANPDIDVKLDTRPGGGDGDNLVKTRLSTGDMADVFEYNSGSLFQAIAPDDEPDSRHRRALGRRPGRDLQGGRHRRGRRLRRPVAAPSPAAACFYNIPLYEELGLEVPTTWDEFMANNEKIKAAGSRPGRADLRRHLDLADLRARPTTTTSRRRTRASPRTTPNNEAKYATTPEARGRLRAPAGRPARRATSTRTSPRPSSPTGSRRSPPARRRTTR